MFKIKIVQENPTVGDISGNIKLIQKEIKKASLNDVDLLVFSEMFVSGYPPEDLVMRADFLNKIEKSIIELSSESPKTALLFGAPTQNLDKTYNSAFFLEEGKIKEIYSKQMLPNYKEFDERRYFSPGERNSIIHLKGIKIGLSICEDIWSDDFTKRLVNEGAELIINMSASPYTITKKQTREKMLLEYFDKYKTPIIYLNQVGGQDELVFDGSSLVIGSDQEKLFSLKSFEIDSLELEVSKGDKINLKVESNEKKNYSKLEDIYNALVIGTRDYVEKNGFNGIILGSSGGIDSALTAAIAFDALGPSKVNTVMMPFDYTADISIEDAQELADNMAINHSLISIKGMYESFSKSLESSFEGKSIDKTEENLQSRCRGVTLMALSNKLGLLVLTTGNKSEAAVGYSTLYGDTAGGFSVLKDVSKTLVYELANYRNKLNLIIPQRIIDRPPSAELAPDQKDTDSLPDYSILDPIIEMYVEKDMSPEDIIIEGYEESEVRRILKLIDLNEYKRRQVPLGIKISDRNFGKDRRYPITNGWKP
ncbi:MAG: NAD+ synthase [Flavobacteriaceae bacterium]|jgi:NAD+ synthase (glutamine-hydrolysing)|nr:NAD+ synthase [Flavobacteriaceae bacterium]|tara:strand:- start:672 stop:2285 length:1614 start_codon:yes stop_codon:yes gene_type:complete